MDRVPRSPLRLHRLARGGSARLFARAMAVLLFLMNFSAWAGPVSHSMWQLEAKATVSASGHPHCGEAAAKTLASTPHGESHPCCPHGACACLHSCPAALPAFFFDLAPLASAHSLPPLDALFADAGGERRLRPPIR